MEDSPLSRIFHLLTELWRAIVGERWKVTPHRLFVVGIATASAIIFAVFLFWVLNTGRNEPIRYFGRVKTGMMYGLWFGVLATYLLILGYVDATYFSGNATSWWQLGSRVVFVIFALVNASQWFWSAWVAVVSGTPSLNELATMGYWKYLFLFNPTGTWSGLYGLVMLSVSWYLPYYLIQEFNTGKWRLPTLFGSPLALAMILVYSESGPPVLPFLLTIAAMFLPLLINLHWRIKSKNVPTGNQSGGITNQMISHRSFVFFAVGTAIGVTSLTGLVLSLYPISSSKTPLLFLMKTSLILTLLSGFSGIRVLRTNR